MDSQRRSERWMKNARKDSKTSKRRFTNEGAPTNRLLGGAPIWMRPIRFAPQSPYRPANPLPQCAPRDSVCDLPDARGSAFLRLSRPSRPRYRESGCWRRRVQPVGSGNTRVEAIEPVSHGRTLMKWDCRSPLEKIEKLCRCMGDDAVDLAWRQKALLANEACHRARTGLSAA